jgi:multidrug efflux pump subunit AcrA (membrane-fusion protein)
MWCLFSCSEEKKVSLKKMVTLKETQMKNHVYYSGIIQPLKTFVVISPEEGVIETMAFHYGDLVQPQQLLFTIHSEKFQSDYKTALMQYIKSKTEFNNNREQLSEAKFLYQNQLISDDDFKAKQTNFYTAQLSLIQSEDALKVMLKQLDVKDVNVYSLSIQDIDKINQALHAKDGSQKIRILAPKTGVALIPMKNETQEGSSPKKILIGDEVKKGDMLAMIGDVSGFTIHINVNEFNINQLKIGQKVTVTGTAFPKYVLQGKISSIDHQAQAITGGLPVFPVEIVIPHLTEEERQEIHIGMSAKVDVTIETPPVITVPIAAVFMKDGMSYVKMKKDQEVVDVPVKTGTTTEDTVVIESSLRAGDQLIV